MQYVRSISGSVSKTWNSINPATLSGAIDVIVVEQEDGSLACSPFHVRFGKFSLLRPYEKKVEFRVNHVKQDFPMKLGEGGEAFFVFETAASIPEALQTSPLVSPAASPQIQPSTPTAPALAEPDPFDLESRTGSADGRSRELAQSDAGIPIPAVHNRAKSDGGQLTPFSTSPDDKSQRPTPDDWNRPLAQRMHVGRAATDYALPAAKAAINKSFDGSEPFATPARPPSPLRSRTDHTARSASPPPLSKEEARTRAINLSKRLWTSNIPSQVTEQGDLMLDMTGYKSSEDESLRAEVIARKILSEELEDDYDIGSLIGVDEKGNLWIYSSEEAKEQAGRKAANAVNGLQSLQSVAYASTDALSDPGYGSDDARSETGTEYAHQHTRRDSDSAVGLGSPPASLDAQTAGDPNRNYAKTLRLTSDQLKTLNLKPGINSMSFSVNRATCNASMYLWRYDVPIVISDIDGTITKSDALGHVLNMIGRDWTHLGVAKLYTDIAANGYNLLYLTSRSVGQADTTRAYLAGVVQDGGYKLPKGPVIMSPDRTIAALRREIYLRKPEVFKMACLRDIMTLFTGSGGNNAASIEPHNGIVGSSRGRGGSPFYAGFGNRFTDALSYRSVNIPSTRIFTINSNAEVSLDLLSLGNYKTGYTSMREIVDHFFPPVGLLVKGGGEEFTDFNYWRDKPLEVEDFSASESEDEDGDEVDVRKRRTQETMFSEDEGEMGDSYLSEPRQRQSIETNDADALMDSIIESVEDDADRYPEEDAASDMLRDTDDEGDDEEGEDVEEEDSEDEQAERTRKEKTPRAKTMDLLNTDLKDLAKVLNPPARERKGLDSPRKVTR